MASMEIAFCNASEVFIPGQFVEGSLSLQITETLRIKGISIRFKGRSNVAWAETNGDTTTTYTSSECYLLDQQWLCGVTDNGFDLLAGRYTYPFQYLLPKGIPSSFTGALGNVRYSAKAEVHVLGLWKFNHTRKRNFAVVAPMYLNAFTDSMMEVRDSNQKMVCCWICTSGPISATFYVNRKGYVLGETVTFHADIENLSTRDVTTWVILQEKQFFFAAGKTNSCTVDRAKVQGPSLVAGQSELWTGQLTVPLAIPASRLLHCNNMDVEYYLKFYGKPSFPSMKFRVVLNVYVGTVPYSDDLDPEVIEAEISNAVSIIAKKGSISGPVVKAENDSQEGSEVKGDKTTLVTDSPRDQQGGETAFSNPTYTLTDPTYQNTS